MTVETIYYDKRQGELIYHYYEDGSIESIENWDCPLQSSSYCLYAIEFYRNGNIRHFYQCENTNVGYKCDGKYLNVQFDENGVVMNIWYDSSETSEVIDPKDYGTHWNSSMLEKILEDTEICRNSPY